MRKLLLLLSLAAVFIVVQRLTQITADWHYVVPVTAGDVLYAAAFDDRPADWALYEGRLSAQAAGGALRIEVASPQSLPFSTARWHFSDFDLTLIARPVDGPLDNGYGVIFRAQDPSNYYLFLISSDGYYRVLREVNGEEKILSDWIPSDLIRQGMNVENRLRVTAQGSTFQFYINDERVELCVPDDPAAISTYVDECIDGAMYDSLVDESLATGQVGVIAVSFEEPGVVVEFDNVLVVGPAESSG